MTYEPWKSYMLNKFDKKMSIRDFLREYQKKDELCRAYSERMRSIGEDLFDNDELVLEVAFLVLRFFREEEKVEEFTLNFKKNFGSLFRENRED